MKLFSDNKTDKSEETMWNPSFLILTLGTVVSSMGGSAMYFAISMLVLEVSKSVFMYSAYLILYSITNIVVPIVVGPLFDKISRRKTIYITDFTSAAVYFGLFLMLKNGGISTPVLLLTAFVFGAIHSIYTIAYKSLFPMLIHPKFYQKAYSISTLLMNMSQMGYLIAAICYKLFGMELLLFCGAVLFFAAASVEIFIKANETYTEKSKTAKNYLADLKEGIAFATERRALLFVIIATFLIHTMKGVQSALWLPYFNSAYTDGYLYYMLVTGAEATGVFWGSLVNYKVKYRDNRKYGIIMLFSVVSIILFVPSLFVSIPIAMAIMLISGIAQTVSDGLTNTAVSSVVEDSHRGRYSSLNLMGMNLGLLLGEFCSGSLGDIFRPANVNAVIGIILSLALFAVMGLAGKKYLKKLFNELEL